MLSLIHTNNIEERERKGERRERREPPI